MRGTRYTEEQIVGILKEQERGVGTEELCRRHGISQQTFYRWKAKYGGLEVGDAQKLKALEDENRRLKRLVADLALDNAALKDVLSKNW
jgi:putative transposase